MGVTIGTKAEYILACGRRFRAAVDLMSAAAIDPCEDLLV